LEEKGVVLCGISLGNSYYSQKNITSLVKFWSCHASKMYPFIPGTPSIHTYKAKGDDQIKATRKARQNHTRLQKYAADVAKQLVCTESNFQYIPLNWDDTIENNSTYQASLTEIRKLYETNQEFFTDVRKLTQGVLDHHKHQEEGQVEKAIDEGKEYLLKELSFLVVSPSILGVDHLTYVYHTTWPIFNKLLNGIYNQKVIQNVGFLVLQKYEDCPETIHGNCQLGRVL